MRLSLHYHIFATAHVCIAHRLSDDPRLAPAGIILGMCLLGAIGDRIGRKRGSMTNACIMTVGAVMLTVMNGATSRGFTIMYMISQFVFG